MSPCIFLKVKLCLWGFQATNGTQHPISHMLLCRDFCMGPKWCYLKILSLLALTDTRVCEECQTKTASSTSKCQIRYLGQWDQLQRNFFLSLDNCVSKKGQTPKERFCLSPYPQFQLSSPPTAGTSPD